MKMRIVYFSGTGNTLLVAQSMAKAFQRMKGFEVILSPVEEFMSPYGETSIAEDVLGIGYPIYDLEAPPVIKKFIHGLKKLESPMPCFIFSTYTSMRLDCDNHTARLLESSNYQSILQVGFKAPAAAFALYGNFPGLIASRIQRFEKGILKKIDVFCQDFYRAYASFTATPFRPNYRLSPLHKLAKNLSNLTLGNIFYKNLRISEACLACAACARSCPEGNIEIIDGRARVKIENGCLRCLRCVQLCPQKAINFTSAPRRADYSRAEGRALFEALGQ